MKRGLASISLILFGLSVVFLLVWTLLESALLGMSTVTERIITFSLLVMPAAIGAVLGVMSLMHKEGRMWLAITGILLNTLFTLFHLMILVFAG
jgi:hypothetical protein